MVEFSHGIQNEKFAKYFIQKCHEIYQIKMEIFFSLLYAKMKSMDFKRLIYKRFL